MSMDGTTRSADGTTIAYQRLGSGPAVVLAGGGLDDGTENAPLAEALARDCTVYNYARRGRGRSGDTLPYAVAREVEDLAAIISVAGGSAHLYGASSGGALVFEAALAGVSARRLAVYEVPYDIAPGTAAQFRAYVEDLRALLAAGDRAGALALFMQLAGSSEEAIAAARASVMWPGLLRLAPTLAYDAACLGDRTPDARRLGGLRTPTLVITGGSAPPFERAADALASAIPGAERAVLEGQAHVVDPASLAPLLVRFFRAGASG